MYEGLKILLGGIVADAASRTLHWIYSDKKLKSYIKGKKDIAFFKENLEKELRYHAGKVKIEIVPNIVNITYGRDVGYKIEQEHFDSSIEEISATKIREEQN